MQTFLPCPDFARSAACLDWRRLGKQRVECLQILNVILGRKFGWSNHPAVQMWNGFPHALTDYMNACITEWCKRGYTNNMKLEPVPAMLDYPTWFGNPAFHASHRAALESLSALPATAVAGTNNVVQLRKKRGASLEDLI